MRHLIYLGLGVVASLLATPPAGAGLLRLDEHDSPGLALGATDRLDAPDWLVAAQGTRPQSLGVVPPDRPDDDPTAGADELPPSPSDYAASQFAAWKRTMFLKRILPGVVFVLAAALVTWDQFLQAKLPTRRRSRHWRTSDWTKGLIAALATVGLLLLAFPLLQGWLVRGLFVFAVLLLLSLWDPFKRVPDTEEASRYKKLGVVVSLALLCAMPGFGMPTFAGTSRFPPRTTAARLPSHEEDAVAPDDPKADAKVELKDPERFEVDDSVRRRVSFVAADFTGEPWAGARANELQRPVRAEEHAGSSRPGFRNRSDQSLPDADQSQPGNLFPSGRRPVPGGGMSSQGTGARRSAARPSGSPPAHESTSLSGKVPEPIVAWLWPSDAGLEGLVEGTPLPSEAAALLPGEDQGAEVTPPETPSPQLPGSGLDQEYQPGVDRPIDPPPSPDGENTGGAVEPLAPTPAAPVVLVAPEPGSLALLSVGAFVLVGYRLRGATRKSRAGSPRRTPV